ELRNRELVAREVTAKVEREMELAKEIQTSLEPPPIIDFGGNMQIHTYQITHYTVGGDWMAVRENGAGDLVMLVADATGKGMQAALVVHAVQALWARFLDDPDFDPADFLDQANRTLLRLGRKKVHSMTVGIAVLSREKLTYWSAG